MVSYFANSSRWSTTVLVWASIFVVLATLVQTGKVAVCEEDKKNVPKSEVNVNLYFKSRRTVPIGVLNETMWRLLEQLNATFEKSTIYAYVMSTALGIRNKWFEIRFSADPDYKRRHLFNESLRMLIEQVGNGEKTHRTRQLDDVIGVDSAMLAYRPDVSVGIVDVDGTDDEAWSNGKNLTDSQVQDSVWGEVTFPAEYGVAVAIDDYNQTTKAYVNSYCGYNGPWEFSPVSGSDVWMQVAEQVVKRIPAIMKGACNCSFTPLGYHFVKVNPKWNDYGMCIPGECGLYWEAACQKNLRLQHPMLAEYHCYKNASGVTSGASTFTKVNKSKCEAMCEQGNWTISQRCNATCDDEVGYQMTILKKHDDYGCCPNPERRTECKVNATTCVQEKEEQKRKESKRTLGTILLLLAAVVLVIIILLIGLFVWMRKYRKSFFSLATGKSGLDKSSASLMKKSGKTSSTATNKGMGFSLKKVASLLKKESTDSTSSKKVPSTSLRANAPKKTSPTSQPTSLRSNTSKKSAPTSLRSNTSKKSSAPNSERKK